MQRNISGSSTSTVRLVKLMLDGGNTLRLNIPPGIAWPTFEQLGGATLGGSVECDNWILSRGNKNDP